MKATRLGFLLACAGRLAAQQTVPADLATALAAAGGFNGEGDPVILIGTLPPSLKITIPSSGSLLGSATFNRAAIAIVAFRGSSDSAYAELTKAVQAAGWKPLVRPTISYGGFQPAPQRNATAFTAGRVAPPLTFCADTSTLTFRTARRRGDSSWIAIRITPPQRPPNYSECSARPLRELPTEAALPVLYNPAEERTGSMGSCFRADYPEAPDGADRSRYSSARGTMQIRMSTDAIADHYAKQLQDSGWVPRGIAAPLPSPAMRSWTRKDSLGEQLLTLVVTPLPRDTLCYSMSIDVRPAPRAP